MIDLQTAYNISSAIGFFICMYKITKLQSQIDMLTINSVLNSMNNTVLNKLLKDKGVITEEDMHKTFDLTKDE
jgi:hypothetical protein